MILKQGTQIIYVPTHANGDTSHRDCQTGFLAYDKEFTPTSNLMAYCRYWSKHSPGELRTKANAELTPLNLVVFQDTVPQEQVDRAIEQYCT